MPLDSWIARIEPAPPGRLAPAAESGLTPPASFGGEPAGASAGARGVDDLRHSPTQGWIAEATSDDGSDHGSDDDPVAAAADSAFAQLATRAALNDELRALSRPPVHGTDWTPQLIQNGRALHALMGVDDPLVNSVPSYDESAIDVQLRTALERLPGTSLASGELAALDALDMALGAGADMAEALSAAIAAAEAAGGPDWAAPRRDEFLSPAPAPDAAESLTPPRDGEFQLAGSPSQPSPPFQPHSQFQADIAGRRADDPSFQVRLEARAPDGALDAGANSALAALDPAYGVGFSFGPAAGDVTFDFERRLALDSTRARDDTVTAAAAAATTSDIAGTSSADFLVGGSANQVIGALAGDDYLYGDTPTNLDTAVHAAANPLTNPSFDTAGGDDIMSGGAGDDSLWGGAGDDRMHGDIPDTGTSLAAEFGFDLGTAGFGDDALWGGDGADSLWGGGGNDALYGEGGADWLSGGDGNDSLYGGDGDDRLQGDGGIDALYGQAGADNLFGYAGDDILVGGEGDDTLAGGDGADEYRFAGATGADALAHAEALGTDTISDYAAADGDTFGLSDADFGFGAAGNLIDGDTYFEFAGGSLGAAPLDASGGDAGPAIVVFGQNTGTDGVGVYYTDDASAMTNDNSYQIADIVGVSMTDVEAADFFLRS